jgi:hypothetical protein
MKFSMLEALPTMSPRPFELALLGTPDLRQYLVFVPFYCLSCSRPTRLDRIDNVLAGKYQAHQILGCSICGIMYQLAMQVDVLRAATASGGDMLEYFVDDDDAEDAGELN